MIAARNVVSGTFGELWFDDEKIAEIRKFDSSIEGNRETIMMGGDMMEDSKLMSAKGVGSMEIYKVYSRFAEFAAAYQRGEDPRGKFVGKVADPDAHGTERWAFYNVAFDAVPVLAFEVGKPLSETVKFRFTKCEPLETIV